MTDVVSLKSRFSSDVMPYEAGRFYHITDIAKQIFGRWGYVPLIPSLFSHGGGEEVRSSLSSEVISMIEVELSKISLPARYWYVGPVVRAVEKRGGERREESLEMGSEFVSAEPLFGEAEMIGMALEILKELGIRDFRLTLGTHDYLKGLLADNVKGARSKAALLKGDEEILRQAKSFSTHERCLQALDDLRLVTRFLREVGHKGLVTYDLCPFLDEETYPSLIFKVECGHKFQHVFVGGRRKIGESESVGFSFDVRRLLQVAQQSGDPILASYVDFLLVNRKKTRKSSYEIMRVLREHGYSVALDHTDLGREELLDYAKKAGIYNLLIVGDEDSALNEVRIIDVVDKIAIKVSISEIFDKKSGLNKLLRYHKRSELEL